VIGGPVTPSQRPARGSRQLECRPAPGEYSNTRPPAAVAAAGLHRNYVDLLERGRRAPTIVVAQKIAAALDTTLADLLGEVEARGR